MVAHVVLFRPRAGLAPDARATLVNAFARALREIPGIRRASVGRRITHGRPYEQQMNENYTFAAVLEFDDVRALRRYLEHPAHDELGQRFFTSFEAALVYDYEMMEGDCGLTDLL